jgi:hypothetical protein
MPVPFLLRVMRDRKRPIEVRINAAKAAAPYCHRALKAVEMTGENGGAVQHQHGVEIHIVDHRPADQD